MTDKMTPTEYFCPNCKQLRLNLANRKTCGNCGCEEIHIGAVGCLDKKELILKYKKFKPTPSGKIKQGF